MGGYDLHTHLAPVARANRSGPPDLYRPEKLIDHLDAAGLDIAVVSIPPPFFRQHLPGSESAAWARAVNDGLLTATAISDRLVPLAYLPLEHPELALAEYQRTRGQFAGTAAAAGGNSVSLADSRLAPLWSELDADRTMLMLHPGTTPDARLDEFYLSNLLGNPVETGIAAAQLVFGNVLSRYPAMRVMLVHCGGSVPSVAGRWQRGVDTARPGVSAEIEPPVKAVRRFYVDCLAHDSAVVDLAATVFGADRIVLGSDWPFPMGTSDPKALVAHRGAEFAQRAASDNARAVLGQ